MTVILLIDDLRNLFFFLNDLWWLGDVLAEDMSLEEVREPHGQLMRDEFARWNREDLCETRQKVSD